METEVVWTMTKMSTLFAGTPWRGLLEQLRARALATSFSIRSGPFYVLDLSLLQW